MHKPGFRDYCLTAGHGINGCADMQKAISVSAWFLWVLPLVTLIQVVGTPSPGTFRYVSVDPSPSSPAYGRRRQQQQRQQRPDQGLSLSPYESFINTDLEDPRLCLGSSSSSSRRRRDKEAK